MYNIYVYPRRNDVLCIYINLISYIMLRVSFSAGRDHKNEYGSHPNNQSSENANRARIIFMFYN